MCLSGERGLDYPTIRSATPIDDIRMNSTLLFQIAFQSSLLRAHKTFLEATLKDIVALLFVHFSTTLLYKPAS